MKKHGFELTEHDYAWLLYAYHQTGEFDKLCQVMGQLQAHVGRVHEPCLRSIAGFFLSEVA